MTIAVEKSHPYPTRVLEGRETALIVFAAAFAGMNDAAWIAETPVQATCVDNDREKLEAMRDLYPDGWRFVLADAYDFAVDPKNVKWDVVSCDPFTNQFNDCAEFIGAWCRLAEHAVVIGTGIGTVVEPPDGWEITEVLKRTDYEGGVFWTVLEPA